VDPRQSPRTTRLPSIVGTDFPYALFTLADNPCFTFPKKEQPVGNWLRKERSVPL